MGVGSVTDLMSKREIRHMTQVHARRGGNEKDGRPRLDFAHTLSRPLKRLCRVDSEFFFHTCTS
jgi:hypothetical protein